MYATNTITLCYDDACPFEEGKTYRIEVNGIAYQGCRIWIEDKEKKVVTLRYDAYSQMNDFGDLVLFQNW